MEENKYSTALRIIADLLEDLNYELDKAVIYLHANLIPSQDIAFIIPKAYDLVSWIQYIDKMANSLNNPSINEKRMYISYIDATINEYFAFDDYEKVSFFDEKLKSRLIEIRSWLEK